MSMPKFKLQLLNEIALGLRNEDQLSSFEVSEKLDEIGRAHESQVENDVGATIDIRRTILRYKLQIFSRRDLPYEVVNGVYQSAVLAKFSSLLDEGTVKIYHAQYCIRLARVQEAKEVLEDLLRSADADPSAPPRVRSELRRDVRGLLESV